MHSTEKWNIQEVPRLIYSWINDLLITSLASMIKYHEKRNSREQRFILVYSLRICHSGGIITVDLEFMLFPQSGSEK